MEFDWAACESELTASAVAAVRTLVAAAAGQRPYAVAFSEFYTETTGVIYLPNLALATEESVPEPSYRFSPPDWEFQDYEWGDTDASWGDRLSEAVTGLPRGQWDEAWERFAQAMLTIAAGVRAAMVADGTLPTDVVVYLDDEDGELLVRSLTTDELQRHFPEYVATIEAERAVLALPIEERVAALAAAAGLIPGPPSDLGRESARELLLELGEAAVAVAISALGRRDTAWLGAKLLADLDVASAKVTDALWAALPLPGPGHDWAATALGRLGCGFEVLTSDLPPASRAAAVSGPYRSFRDHGRGHRPMDYTLLAGGLADPTVAALVAEELAPGRGYCTLDSTDLPGARLGLDHAEPVIRRHAVVVIGELIGPLGPEGVNSDDVTALRAQITKAAAEDPDDEVRRLAGYC
ncbi:hypothetical protein BOO86_22475 [Mycobacterium sp. CBMA 234]|uniref:DUF4303 domain-containing protein n=1 Tax=Mycolicibacterium sp. CBMA 234 TaxID=1918495 RepID=UPI0012DF76BF|nr:DUF4303 domain-containing protein [Mycolicibacterium sp. CBMA 234]MUL67257.1 hypothetical protein [Mycolicibacterium sp. CBMA 234]